MNDSCGCPVFGQCHTTTAPHDEDPSILLSLHGLQLHLGASSRWWLRDFCSEEGQCVGAAQKCSSSASFPAWPDVLQL